MSNDPEKTIRFRRPAAPGSETPGAADAAATAEFELVSTQMLERILVAENKAPKQQIEELADSDDGWLAREADGDRFEIVKDAELEAALRAINEDHDRSNVSDASFERVDALKETANGLCLVSTQHLRRVLKPDAEDTNIADEIMKEARGFNPYDNS